MRNLLQEAGAELANAGIESATLDARLLLQHTLNCDHAFLVANANQPLSTQQHHEFSALLQRRLKREPLSHIVGQREFWKDSFIVSTDVLDPRPDSETLIEALLNTYPDTAQPYDILDLGTGSGCLILSLLREYAQASGIAVDVSEAALEVAKRNAHALGMSHRVNFCLNDWGKALQSQFDMIISNPPYIAEEEILGLAPEVQQYEPHGALSGGADGLHAYRALMPQIKRLLKENGVAVVELGAGQCDAVSEIARNTGLQVRTVRADLAGIERALVINHS